jgi:hypothetical protein
MLRQGCCDKAPCRATNFQLRRIHIERGEICLLSHIIRKKFQATDERSDETSGKLAWSDVIPALRRYAKKCALSNRGDMRQ